MSVYAKGWKQRLAERLFRITQKLVGYPLCWAAPWHHKGEHVDPVVYDGKEQTCTWCGEPFGVYIHRTQHEHYEQPDWAVPIDDAITEHLTGEDVGDSKDEPESVVR